MEIGISYRSIGEKAVFSPYIPLSRSARAEYGMPLYLNSIRIIV